MRSFYQYQRRPVYVVQCFSVWACLNHVSKRFPTRLRVVKAYRTLEDQATRNRTARVLRQMRADGLTRKTVKALHEKRLTEPGVAVRVDIDQELERMGNR